jgi:putative transposase
MPSAEPSASLDLSQIPESAWAIANARFAAIEPLIAGNYSRAAVEEQAAAVGVDISTLYRWLKKFRKSHLVADLLPHTRGRLRRGQTFKL